MSQDQIKAAGEIVRELQITIQLHDIPALVAAIHRAYMTGWRDGSVKEREACALVASDRYFGNPGELGDEIATAIRARSQP